MNYNTVTVESSVVKDITDIITDGIKASDDFFGFQNASPSISKASSLTKATSGLNLVFPVLVSNSLPIDTAISCSRAVERKAVSLLQIAFSAFDITNSRDATEFIKNFHTNLKGKWGLDDFIDAMDSYATENSLIPKENMNTFKSVLEDLRSISYYFPDDIRESCINDYKVVDSVSGKKIIKEDLAEKKFDYQKERDKVLDNRHDDDMTYRKERDRVLDNRYKDDMTYRKERDEVKDNQYANDREYQKQRDDLYDDRYSREEKRKQTRDNVQNAKDSIEMINKQLLPYDIKKANEMVPSMIVVNFITVEGDQQITRQVVLGVKAKMIAVDPQDVINKIVTKNVDNNIMLKFIKASTKEISFIKDFIFAIDNAKLTAISNSKHGSQTNRLLKVLERRALGGKVRKAFRMNNAYKAISTLVISKEEVDAIAKYNNIDVMNPRVMRKIMEDLNLMIFIVADESAEAVSMLLDTGDDNFETISYTHLEREASDGSSKKAINLMTKLAR